MCNVAREALTALSFETDQIKTGYHGRARKISWPLLAPHHAGQVEILTFKYRSTSLCQTCLSRIHGLCRSDHPFPNFSPILHCNSTLLMSNSVIVKTRLFRSDYSFPKVNFPFVYHCLYRSGQKVTRSE